MQDSFVEKFFFIKSFKMKKKIRKRDKRDSATFSGDKK